jgi:methionyl-tRNA formyltransferase
MTQQEKSMQERLTRLETLIESVGLQYQGVLGRLDTIADKLANTAVANNEIQHLKEEQLAQWKKIDINKEQTRIEFDKLHKRIDDHMQGCAGPAQALEIAREAKELALDAAAAARTANHLPGKYALATIGGLLLLLSNVAGGVILYLVTK